MKRLVLAILLTLALAVPVCADEPNLTMKAGADYRLSMTWTDPVSKAPINLTGNSYAAQFRAAPGGALFANYSAIVTNAATGQMDLRLSKSQTQALSGKAGVWDLRQTDVSGLVTYQFGGKAIVLPTVTRP